MSLFASLLLVILGSKNKYCLSFGFIILGVSLILFILYFNDKFQKELNTLNQEIDGFDIDETVEDDEKLYILQHLYIRQKQITRSKKRISVVFAICGVTIALLGIFGMF